MASMTERLAKALGLPPESDEQEVHDEIMRLCDAQAENYVSAAIRGGTILAAHRDHWSNAFKTDHEGTKAVLESLMLKAKQPPAAQPAAAALITTPAMTKEEGDAVLWKLGARAGLEPPPRGEPTAMLRNSDGTPYVSKPYLGY
jgi:hypothetical protein